MHRHSQFALTLLCVLVLIGWNRLSIAQECSEIEYGGTMTLGSAPNADKIRNIVADEDENLFVVGEFEDTVDFDPTDGIDLHTSIGGADVFVSKYSSEGDYEWTRTWGSTEPDSAYGLTVTDHGILISGLFFLDVDFDSSKSEDWHSSNGNHDVFVTKYLTDGNYDWTQTFGGPCPEGLPRIASATDGNIFVVGCFNNTVDFDPTEAGEDIRSAQGLGDDIYLSKWTSTGSYLWTAVFGGVNDDGLAQDIGFDPEGNVIVSGTFEGAADFDPSEDSAYELVSVGSDDIFVVEVSSQDAKLLWAISVGGVGLDYLGDVLVEEQGNVIITGNFNEGSPVDFDPTIGVDEKVSNGSTDIFVTKLTTDGSYHWTWTAGGVNSELGAALALDANGGLILSGRLGTIDSPPGYTVNFDQTGGGDFHITAGGSDVFVTRLLQNGIYGWTYTMGGTANEEGFGIAATQVGELLIAGYFSGRADFDPTGAVDLHSTSDRFDMDAYLTTLICTETPSCDGDVNGDGTVDPLDSGFVMSRFDCPVGQGDLECDSADANKDFVVDPLDTGYVLSRFGTCTTE